MSSWKVESKPLHYNIPQIKVMLVRAWENYLVMGRGTGKSSGILSPWLVDNARDMPRSSGGIVGATFMQLLVRTLPPAISNWARMGYVRDVHYIIGREPDEKWKRMWNWQGPRTMPLDSKYAIYWFNGSSQVLISQDRVGSSNGLSLAYIGGDEAKLLNKERLDDEIMPTLRGDRSYFGHLSCYRSKMFLTDMPTASKSKWILEKEGDMDRKQVKLIMELQLHINILKKELNRPMSDDYRYKQLNRIAKLEAQLNKLRQGSIYYAEASVMDNIDVLGIEFLNDMRRQLSPAKFDASIMNKRTSRVEGGFYQLIDTDKHGQEWVDYSWADSIDYDFDQLQIPDCRKDGGMLHKAPLDVAFDYGAQINCMVVGQEVGNEYRVFNSLYVLHPQLITDVVDKFCKYYAHYPTKEVNYYYDHTAIAASGITDFTYRSQVVEAFERHKWTVNEIYCGQAPTHDRKYEFWGVLLQENDSRMPAFRYHRVNCEKLETSMLGAGLKQTPKGFEKDKSPERDPDQAQEDATHLSDAMDTLLFFKYHKAYGIELPFIATMHI
jgi:hypothetical protein